MSGMVNAGNKNTPSCIHEDGMSLPLWLDKKGHTGKISPKMVNLGDIARNAEEEEEDLLSEWGFNPLTAML